MSNFKVRFIDKFEKKSTYELIEVISASDIWRINPPKSANGFVLKPIYEFNSTLVRSKSNTSIDSLQIQLGPKKSGQKNFDLLSLVLQAEPVKNAALGGKILMYRSAVGSVKGPGKLIDPNLLGENVLLEFIINNLKKQFVESSIKSSLLNVYLICKVIF